VRPEDPEHLADVLAELLLDDEARREMARTACQTVHREFNAEAMAQGTLEIYRSLLSRK
jgi:glycosyltransferase involved in cell wall biosynthesis